MGLWVFTHLSGGFWAGCQGECVGRVCMPCPVCSTAPAAPPDQQDTLGSEPQHLPSLCSSRYPDERQGKQSLHNYCCCMQVLYSFHPYIHSNYTPTDRYPTVFNPVTCSQSRQVSQCLPCDNRIKMAVMKIQIKNIVKNTCSQQQTNI